MAHTWASNGPEWRLVEVTDADTVRSVQVRADRAPLRFGLLGREAESATTAYELRAFGATYEDPVTGSLHGSAAQWMRERGLVPTRFQATQGSQVGRAGQVHVHDDGDRVWIGGHAAITVDGWLHLPAGPRSQEQA